MENRVEEFVSRNPMKSSFWDERFERAFTPWDQGGVPPALKDFASRNGPLRCLIPGCGAAYEAGYLSDQGWDVTAIDFSAAAVAQAKAGLGRWAERALQADFFEYQPAAPLQMIYERAFLCALLPAMRQQVAERWAALLPPGGLLAGFFYFDDKPKGPPFGIMPAELDALLAPYFILLEDAEVPDSIPVFAGKERWKVWRRR
jgi:hypothetical protein